MMKKPPTVMSIAWSGWLAYFAFAIKRKPSRAVTVCVSSSPARFGCLLSMLSLANVRGIHGCPDLSACGKDGAVAA